MGNRRVSVELLLETAHYVKGGTEAVTITRRVHAELDRLGDQADSVSRDMDELAANTGLAKHEVDDLGDKAVIAAAELRALGRQADSAASSQHQMAGHTFDLGRAVHEATAELSRLNAEFARTGDPHILADIRRVRRELKELTAVASAAGGAAGDMGSGMLDFGGRGLRPMHAAIGGLVAMAALAAPTIGAMVAGAVTGAVGLGGIVGGIFAASRDPGVEQAWQGFASNVSSKFFQMGGDFAEPLVDAAHRAEAAFDKFDLASKFKKAAPYLDDIMIGLEGFSENLGLGIDKALGNAGPALEILRKELPELGDALGYMFSKMSEGKGTVEGLEFLMGTLEAVLKGTGNVIHFLSYEFERWIGFLANFSGMMEDIPGPFQDDWREANDVIEDFIADASEGQQVLNGVSRGFQDTSQSIDATATSIRKLDDAFAEHQAMMLALDNATLAYKADVLNLKEAVKEHGHSLRDNTAEGLNNQQMILGLVGDLQREREAAIKTANGNQEKTDKANANYQSQIKGLKEMLIKLGFEKAAVDALVGAYDEIPTRITTTIIQDYQTRGVPAGEHSGLRINETRTRAAGGDAIPGVPYIINERGYETVTFNAGGMGQVHPATLTPAAMGGGTRSYTINVNGLVQDPREAGRQIVAAIEAYEGGNGDRWRNR